MELELIVKKGVYPIHQDVEEVIAKKVEHLPRSMDGIILYSDKLRTGVSNENGIYRGGKHVNVGAALLKKGYTLKDMERDDLEIYYLNPQLYFTDEREDYEYGTSQTIKSKISLVWFILTLLITFVILSFLWGTYPRNQYYHIKDKRVIIS